LSSCRRTSISRYFAYMARSNEVHSPLAGDQQGRQSETRLSARPTSITVEHESQWQARERLPALYEIGRQLYAECVWGESAQETLAQEAGDVVLWRTAFYREYGHATAIDLWLDVMAPEPPPSAEASRLGPLDDRVRTAGLWVAHHPDEAARWLIAVQAQRSRSPWRTSTQDWLERCYVSTRTRSSR
jgi:hypothetical protein